jgi:zinc transport system ATP-binding protein
LTLSPQQPAEPVLEVVEARVDLGARPVLGRVSLAVHRGEVVALLGANGSGKSTLVRTIVGLVPVTSGSVRLFGVPLRRFRDWHRLGFVPQRMAAASGVPATVAEVVATGRLAHRRSWLRRTSAIDRAVVTQALETVGMADRMHDSVARLSGGQQQRVLIARALAAEPEVLILDEPMAGVDLPIQQAFADALRALIARGTTILLVAHELGALEPLITRAVVLRHGVVVHDGDPPRAARPHTGHGHDHEHPHGEVESSAGLLS